MKVKRIFLMLGFLSAVVTGCDLLGIFSDDEAVNEISYYSKEVEFSTYVDPDGYFLEPVERRIYGEDGKLKAIFKNFYADQALPADDYPYYANDKTEVYEVDDAGTATLIEYYLYTYQRDEYEYTDDEGVTELVFDYILNRGESYTPDDVLRLYYDVTYIDDPVDYDYYTLIEDKRADTDDVIARQESTYITDGGGLTRYRTEKFYSLAAPDDTEVSLSREFAAWYDADDDDENGEYDYLYELYHSYYGDVTDSANEFYYFTRYSRNDNGDIYEQADQYYDDTGIPQIVSADYENGTFDATFVLNPVPPLAVHPGQFVYEIDFDNIGAKANILNTEYDSLGNITKDVRSLNGEISEIVLYTYNDDSELIDESRYTKGGSLLRDRITISYRDEYRDGIYYRVKETTTFKYYDYEGTDEDQQSSVASLSFSGSTSEGIRSLSPNVFRKKFQ